MRLDLVTLKLFLSVVDEKNMTRAAARENITVPAISKRVMDLEEMLGVVLFERHSTGMSPTPAGAALATEARDVFHRLDRIRGRMSEYASGQRGQVRVLCSPSGLIGSFPEQLKAFIAGHPLIDVRLDECRGADVVRGVVEGRADVGIFTHRARAEPAAGEKELNIVPYQIFDLVLVAPTGHPLLAGKRVTFADVSRHEFVGFSESSAVGALVADMTHDQGIEMKSTLLVNGFEAARRMVQAGLGVSIIPEPCALPFAGALQLGAVPLAGGKAKYRIDIATRAIDTLSVSAMRMTDYLTRGGVIPEMVPAAG